MNQYIITEEQMANIETWYGNSLMITTTFKHCREHPYNPQAERKEYLGKIALRIRNEFTQDDDEEWYLCADDFESVLDELNQEIEDEAELRQGGKDCE